MKFKRILTALVLVCFLFASTSFAWVNLAITAAELAAPVLVSGAINYFLPSSPTTNVPLYGRADNYGIKRNGIGVRNGIAMAVTLGLSYMAIRDILRISGSSYPSLIDAMSMAAVDPGSGAIVTAPNGNNYQLTLASASCVQGSPGCGGSSSAGGWLPDVPGVNPTWRFYESRVIYGSQPNPNVSGSYNYLTIYNITQVSSPSTVGNTVTDSEFAAKISDSTGAVKPAYQHDLDAMMLNNPSSVTKPDTAVSENALAATANQVAQNLASASEAAKAARDAAQAIYNANPTDENLLKLKQAEAAYQKSLADQQAQQDQQTKEETENTTPTEPPANNYDANIESPEKKNIGTLIRNYISSSPLSTLLNSIGFSRSDSSPTIYLFDAYGESFTGDFSPYESYFNTAGLALLSFAHIIAVFILFRKEIGGE